MPPTSIWQAAKRHRIPLESQPRELVDARNQLLVGGTERPVPVKVRNMKRSKGQNEDDENLHDFLSQIPDRFFVAEEELDRAVYEEYERCAEHLMNCLPQVDGLEMRQALFDPTVPLDAKREMLVRLVLCGTVDAYRAIEQYVKNADPALEQWGKIALCECRMRLESELLEEPVGIVSTGLGGAQHRLRYLVVIGLACGVLHDGQRRRAESAWRTICGQYDSVLECVNVFPTHVILTLLVSMETAVGAVIDAGIAAANGDDPILRRQYFVTNVAVPTEEEIQRILTERCTEEAPG